MRHSALDERRVVALLALAAALTALLVQPRAATAQSCPVPTLNDDVCATRGGSIDDYKACYRDLYDGNVIPAFRAMAECTHAKAEYGIDQALEESAALVISVVERALADIQALAAAEDGAPGRCIGVLNAAEALLRPYLDAESSAPDLGAYRRATYTPEHMTYFQDVLLTARQNRAACDGPLQTIRRQLVLLQAMKVDHLDYCELMRDSASYQSVSSIKALAQWTAVDPDIDFDQYFHVSVTWNSQCGYYDFSGGSTSIEYAPCTTLTTEYAQTLATMDGALGWLAEHRTMITATGTAIATTIFSLAGYGTAAGPYGALVGAAVGLVLTGIEYLSMQWELDELEDLIADKERQLRDAVAENVITEEEFSALITERCTPWQQVVERRAQNMLRDLDPQRHVAVIDGYYTLSDRLHDWYNGLFLWATTPGPDGRRVIDDLAQQQLLARKNQFEQRIFGARADQEVANQKTVLTNQKGRVTLLGCANLSASQRRLVRNKLNSGINAFNQACSATMSALAVQPDQPVPFADGAVASTVVCSYRGFRTGVASLEIGPGDGFASTMTVKDAAGAVVARLDGVTSDTDFDQAGLPGFQCASDTGNPFGTSADTRLADGTYPMRLQDNIFGFDASDASSLRSSVQSLDSQLRFKAIVCARQLGTPVDLPRTADACGVPTLR